MPFPKNLQPSEEKTPNRKNFLIQLIKWTGAAVLLLAGLKQIVEGLKQLQGREIVLAPAAMLFSAFLYAGGMICFAAYWRRSALEMGGRLSILEAQRTYFASQMGKYIPGKAWVLLIRYGLTNRRETSAAVIVASTFYETLAMMAAGAIVSLFCLLMAGASHPSLVSLAVALSIGLLASVQPWIFTKLLALGMLPFQRWGGERARPVSYRMLFEGLIYLLPGWALAGLSLAWAAKGVGVSISGVREILLACGSMSLAVVGGFAVLIVPAGLGVREWVLMRTLGPTLGEGNAALIAIAARVMNIVAELLLAGGLYFFVKRNPQDA